MHSYSATPPFALRYIIHVVALASASRSLRLFDFISFFLDEPHGTPFARPQFTLMNIYRRALVTSRDNAEPRD